MAERVRTLHITTVDLTAWCFLRSWFSYLQAHGAEVTLACTVGRFLDDLEETGAEVLHLPIERRIRPLQDLASLIDLIFLIRRLRPDVIHTHTSKAGFLGRAAARLAGAPLILHTIHELPQNASDSPWVKRLYRALERLAATWAHHLITVSKANEEQILRERICPPSKLTMIREGICLERYHPSRGAAEVRQELGIPEGAPLIGCVARLEEAKGHGDLLEAFRQLRRRKPEAWLVLVGQGPLRPSLEARARALGVADRVIFTGFRDDMIDLLNSFDLFALASHYEGLGIVLLEAHALGKPVVCTAVGGTRDVILHEETGLLVPRRDPARLCEAMIRVLDDPALAARIAQGGRDRVQAEFREEAANQQMLALYRQQSGRRPGQLLAGS